MNVLIWIIFGLIIGIASGLRSTKKPITSIQENAVLGIIGALVGGFLGTILFGVTITGLNIRAVIIAILGAIGLVYLSKIIITLE